MKCRNGACGETNTGTRESGSGLRRSPFGTSGSGAILIATASAPTGNWPVFSELCSSIVLVTSLPTVPGAVPWKFRRHSVKSRAKQVIQMQTSGRTIILAD